MVSVSRRLKRGCRLIRPVRKSGDGFSLIELMVTLVLMGLLINLVIPVGDVAETARLDHINQSIFSSVSLARSEAIKRVANVSVCQSNDGTACDLGADWSEGWVIFENPNNDDVIDGGEEIIRIYNPTNAPVDIEWSNGNRLDFTPRGHTGTAGSFTLCPDNGANLEPRQVIITGSGHIRRSTGTGNC